MTLEKVLRWIALGGIFALPFIVFLISTSLFFPFITGKNFAFRLIIEVITGAWLALALVNSAYRPQRQWLLGAFAIFVILIALADAFGVYPFKSFWSNYERMDGWITLAHLFLYFVVSSSMLSTEKLWRAFLQVSLAVSAVVGAHALLQLLGVASLNPGFSSATRLDATFGNPIYLASYMLFHVFIAALLLAHSGKEQWNRTERYVVGGIFTGAAILALSVFGKSGLAFYAFFTVLGSIGGSLLFMRKTYLLAFILTLDAVVLFLTGTRGAILGLSGGVMLAAFLFALSARDYQMRARQAVAGAVVIVLVLVGGLYLARDQSWVKDAPVLGRIATISIMESTAQARIMNWGVAWQGVKERPVLGWGQENFAIVFNKYYNPQMYGQEQWFDRVHNVVFDWLVAGGVLGLLAYLSLFVFALWYIWRRDAGERSFTVSEGSILTGLLAAYFFHNLFVFDNVMSYFLFASVLAFVSFRAGEHANRPRLITAALFPLRSLPFISAIIAVSVFGVVWFANTNPLASNKALLQALAPHSEGLLKNLDYFEKAISYNTLGNQEAREQLAQAAMQIARREEVPIETKQKFLETAARELTLQSEASPLDPRPLLFLGVLLNTYGLYTEAEPILARAYALSPTKQSIILEVAANAIARDDIETALSFYKEAYELAPNFTDAHILYAAVAIHAKQDKLAEELLTPLIASGNVINARIASAYASRERYDKIVSIWEAHLQKNPEDIQARFTLASAYYAAGNAQRAIEQLEIAARANPSYKEQTEALMHDIRSGALRIE
ncbi:hypothetical protein A3H15_01420 [Candidatus Kaiserbacteria bacterium RIFCSPLOWO2_12_FULL_50_28]|uniref:O-antigen ligase-related domain-containing protein n=1 Tax=Candidatus Kaiserbacteria bacterium RIFCSPLOWO2_12_FULL_50_28 TaxID=1798527 RepID=A0A1F6FMZ4_9BACT|nr:MAG: hypothetical protein A3H15_01420 [Candidatus Kaiserbacteria bacterium RIFCSPLOWO2_12_FULL_50_28]